MAKTIKFNLICDGNPVRTIDDLQNNFSIEDVLAYYNNRLLHRWLKVHGYEKELETVESITDEKPIDIIKSLVSIFNVEIDEKDIEEGVYILNYLDERKELYSIYERESYKVKNILEDYLTGYKQLVYTIIENGEDIAKIKVAISEILENYYAIFEINYRMLFWQLFYHAPTAVYVMLTFVKAREFYLPQVIYKPNTEEPCFDIDYYTDDNEDEPIYADKREMYEAICNMIKDASYDLKDNLKIFSGVTDGYWKDLEEKGKEYMILSMDSGDFVRSAGEKDGDLGSMYIKNRFVILNGIDYKSNNANHKLLYMEV